MLWQGGLEERRIRAAVQRLCHRGPDGEGVWLSPDGRVGLGHRRLRIVGIRNGAQPISNEDGTMRIVVNGEFYGFERQRFDLERCGHQFQTLSDSEVALHLYEDCGLEFLAQLRGEFALLLWDGLRNRLIAARDRFGIKPLVYQQSATGILLSSEAKSLFAMGVDAEWDHDSLLGAMAVQYVLPDRTLFRGIRQVPPGCVLIATAENVRVERYWDLPEGDPEPSIDNQADLIAGCREAVVDAVRVRLRAEVPVCCQLSGGIDSSAVLGIAASESTSPLHAYTVAFDHAAYDESSTAATAASHCGAVLHRVSATPVEILAYLPVAVEMSEGLCINGHLVAKYLLHRAIHEQGYKVVLTGEGADEAFAGYAHLRIDYWRSIGRADLVSTLAASNRSSLGMMLPHGAALDLSGVSRRLGFVPAWMEAKATLGARLYSILRSDVQREFDQRDRYGELVDTICGSARKGGSCPVNQSARLWVRSALANYILKTLGDGTEMAHSVEGRVPFLDHHLWEFLRRVPLDLKIRGATEKYLLREAMLGFVPEPIRLREKHPFDAPPMSFVRLAEEELRDQIRSSAFRAQPLFDADRLFMQLERLHDLDETTRMAWDPVFMTVLSVLALQVRLSAGWEIHNA
jgi:asparagine synthase (glutamine-hydrolysing)